MKFLYISILFFLGCFIAVGQLCTSDIRFQYNPAIYLKIAKDTIGAIVAKQNQITLVKDANLDFIYADGGFSVNQLYTETAIPIFRISSYAFNHFDSTTPIEPLIVFEERYKYQIAKATFQNYVGHLIIPNRDYEAERSYPGQIVVDDKPYGYIRSLKFWPDAEMSIYEELMQKHPERFYFMILGLDECLFFIDADHKMYGQSIADRGGVHYGDIKVIEEEYLKSLQPRPINEFIQKYIGNKTIRELAAGLINMPYLNIELHLPYEKYSGAYPEGCNVYVNIVKK